MRNITVLIDALNLQSKGGNALLSYLVEKLQEDKISYELLLGHNLTGIQKKILVFSRKKIILEAVKRYSPKCIFCFGNFPLHFSVPDSIRVVVNFQNAFLLKNSDVSAFNGLKKFKFWMRRSYLNFFLNKADLYIFPTAFIKNQFIKTYVISPQKCRVIPYFNKGKIDLVREATKGQSKIKNSFVYISSSSKHKNHIRLFKVWELLAEQKLFPLLTLSISLSDARSKKHLDHIALLKEKGLQIENINDQGHISYKELLKISARHEFTIFPSLNETFGFGTIEGAILGNKLLISDRPFVKDVTVPSLKFDPLNTHDILDKVTYAMNHELPDTQLVFEDKIDELLELLTSPNTQSFKEYDA